MALDYAAALRGGASLVPDLAAQLQQRELMDQRREQFQWARDDRTAQVSAQQAEQEQAAAYQEALESALLSGRPQDIAMLMARFPQMRESVAPVYEMMDEMQRRRDVTQIGSIYSNAQQGNWERAAELLEERIRADGADADPNDRAILAGLRSQDPIERTAAMQTVGVLLAAATGEEFTAAYGRLSGDDATEREYQARLRRFGREAADEWLAGQDVRPVPIEGGGMVYDARDFARPQRGGGDPASGGGAVSGDAAPAPSISFDQFLGNVRSLGPDGALAWARRNGVVVQVRNVDEANALPPGTSYLTPDGRRFVR